MGESGRQSGRKGYKRAKVLAVVLSGILVFGIGSAGAFNIDTGVSDLKIRWDNTVKYSAAFRVEGQDSKVLGSTYNPNLDDGDRNFNAGLISNRLDVLSEVDAVYKGFGARVSGAGWYDTVYNSRNDNNSPMTFNGVSVAHDEFTDDTQDLHGRKAEFLDAFVFGKVGLWDNGSLSMRLGRYTLLYGESLFYGGNGIAGAQAPMDIIKLVSVPNSQFKEIGMPVPQVSSQLQILPGLSLGGYFQFDWRKTRIPASGSYFSYADVTDDGGERFIGGPPLYPGGPLAAFYRGGDIKPRASQFGGQIKFKPKWGDIEYGLYAARFNDKEPQIYLRPGVGAGPMTPVTGQIGDYVLVYAEKIWVYGASLATTVGDANVSAEVSYRHDMPLAATGGVVAIIPGMAADGDKNAAYPVGDTFHAQISMIKLFSPTFLWGGASLVGEVAYNRRVNVDRNEDHLDPNCTRDAMGLRMVFEPQYFQVMPQVDLSVPIGLGFAPFGRSSLGTTVFGPEHGGDVSIGLTAEYLKTWKAGLQFTHYFGPEGALVNAENAYRYLQLRGDRDFISFSVQRTF
jgi:hypothetical protein